MENYEPIKNLGAGSFGTVFAAIDKQNGGLVAIKQLKEERFCSWEECLNLPEVRSLKKLKHPNIVGLKDVIMDVEYGTVFFVFEYMQGNLSQLVQIRRNNNFSESQVRNMCYQILLGLHYMHMNGYMHRDMKPANLLVNQNGGEIKIGDLGSAMEINSGPYTDYVTTRWYRAPEVLLGSAFYTGKVDMWAMGVIMAELFNLRPLFPGVNAAHQMHMIWSVMGNQTWGPEGPKLDQGRLSWLIPSASDSAINLIASLCSWNPRSRPTAAEALQHPFFVGSYRIPRAIHRSIPPRHGHVLPALGSSTILV